MSQTHFPFAYRFRVRWSEVDPQGVVFNARYLDYADLAITEYWRTVDFRALSGPEPLEFHVANAVVDYKQPIKKDELIDARIRTERFGNSSMTVLVELHGASEVGADDLRAVIREVQVHVDLTTHRPQTLPQHVRDSFAAFDARGTMMLRGEGIGEG